MNTQGKSINRIESIDFVKGIAIVAVTLGHILCSFRLENSTLCVWVYSFELPAFFIASGYLAQLKQKTCVSLQVYIKQKVKSILYPYVMFCFAIAFLETILCLRHGALKALHQFIDNTVYICTGLGLGALWFMPTFFFSNIFAFILYKKIIHKSGNEFVRLIFYCITVAIIGGMLSYVIEQSSYIKDSVFEGFFVWKQIVWHLLSQISRSIVGASLILTGRLFILLRERYSLWKIGGGRLYLAAALLYIGFYLGNMQYKFVDLHFSFIRNPFLFYSSAVCTTAGLILIGQMSNVKIINWLGKNSLIIMFCQIIQKYWCTVLNKLFQINICKNSGVRYLATFISLVAILLISSIVVWVINKNKIFNILIKPRGEAKCYTHER